MKPPKDWHPPIREASNDIAYIEVSVVFIDVSNKTKTALLYFHLFSVFLIYIYIFCSHNLCLIFQNKTVQMFLSVSYTQYKTSKEGSTMGITVSHSAMLAHCHALTQACGYTEGEDDTLHLLL